MAHHPQQQAYNNQNQVRKCSIDSRPARPQSVNMSASVSRHRMTRSPDDSESSSPSPRMETPEESTYNHNWRKHEGSENQWSGNPEHYRQAEQTLNVTNQVIGNHLKGFQRRPVARNSNLLSAVLCLVKELDYQSLEVLDLAIRCRMDEIVQQ